MNSNKFTDVSFSSMKQAKQFGQKWLLITPKNTVFLPVAKGPLRPLMMRVNEKAQVCAFHIATSFMWAME